MSERGRWRIDEQTGEVIAMLTTADYLAERSRRIELEERERLAARPHSIVKGATL